MARAAWSRPTRCQVGVAWAGVGWGGVGWAGVGLAHKAWLTVECCVLCKCAHACCAVQVCACVLAIVNPLEQLPYTPRATQHNTTPPWPAAETEDDTILELQRPFWIDPSDVRVRVGEAALEVDVRGGALSLRRTYWRSRWVC